VWTVGLCLYGLLIGSIVHGIGDELAGAAARDVVVRMGGTKILEQAFIAAAFSMLGMMAAAFAVSLTLRLQQEETGQHTETLLSGSVSRSRWLTGHLVLALAGSAAATGVAGVVAGLTYGVSAHDVGRAGRLHRAVSDR
jgi:ABC-2 type transport system permease protein